MRVWQPVIVLDVDHPKFNQAGTVQSVDQAPDSYGVKFDGDQEVTEVPAAALRALV